MFNWEFKRTRKKKQTYEYTEEDRIIAYRGNILQASGNIAVVEAQHPSYSHTPKHIAKTRQPATLHA